MDNSFRSYLIYYGLAFICFVLAGIGDKKSNKRYVFLIALLLSLIMGLRKQSVGIDTQNYYGLFASTKKLSDIWKHSDPLFFGFAYLLMKIDNDAYFPIFVISCISNFLVIYRLWDFRDISSYKYAVLRYITIFYFFSFNCMRQFLSIAIVFYGTRYLRNENYIKYLVYVVIASTMHISSIVAASFILLERIRKDELTKIGNNYSAIAFLSLPFYIFLSFYLTEGRYERYFSNIGLRNLDSLLIKLIIFIIVFYLIYKENRIKKSDSRVLLCMIYYLIGLIANGVGVFFSYIERAGYYYYIFGPVYVGIIAKEKRYRLLFRLIILFIVIRAFVLNCQTNSMGQMPYLFNWE